MPVLLIFCDFAVLLAAFGGAEANHLPQRMFLNNLLALHSAGNIEQGEPKRRLF
jgi:hypothetical protein